jgi:hypothetical protein
VPGKPWYCRGLTASRADAVQQQPAPPRSCPQRALPPK